MTRQALKVAAGVAGVACALALADVGYQLYRAAEDSRAHCGVGLAGDVCRSVRHGFVHVRLVAAVEALGIAVVAALIAGALVWLRRRASSAARRPQARET